MDRVSITRERLQTEALRLFSDRGFDDVTVEEVARAAGVSHMTFFRHFPTKESVVLDDPYDPMVGAAIAGQEPGLGAIQRVCAGLLSAYSALPEPTDEVVRRRIRLAAGHRGLRARLWENNQRTEDVIVESLVATGVEPFEAKVAAGAALGAVTAALLDWAGDEPGVGLGDRLGAALALVADVGPAR